MSDQQNREDWRREHSLLALGEAMRGEDDEDRPPQDDAAARHRLARSRREAKPSPLIAALAEARQAANDARPERPLSAGRSAEEKAASGVAGWLPGWLKRKRARKDAAAAPRPEPSLREEGADEPRMPAAPAPRSYAAPVPAPPPTVISITEADQQWKPLIDPMKVVGGVARSKLLIAAMTILGAVLGVAIALSTPKKYEAIAELIVDPRDLKLTENDLTQSMIASDATLALVENQARVLTSGAVLNRVVDKLNLTNDPEFNGQDGGFSVMALVRSLLSRHDGPGAGDEVRRRALAVSNLAESLSVERGGKTFVISIGVTTEDGEKSALIANTMTDVFLQTYGEIQSDTASRATNELTARLDELRKSVETAERKVEDFRAAHDLVDAQGHLISDDELLKLNEQLSIARARTMELNARASSARSANVDSVLGGALPEELNSNTMSDLRSQYATIKQEADRAAVRLGPRHPERLALDAQLAGARDRIAAELRRIVSSLQVDLKRAVKLEQGLASRLAQLKVRNGDVNRDLVSLRELEREATAKRSVYEAFLLRAKQTGEQRDINTANVSVISKAYAPLESEGPSRAVLALAGLLLGFASGVGLGAMRGAYESLRETAGARSRGGAPDRQEPLQAAASGPVAEPAMTGTERATADEQASIEEIRASLREFREAVRELTESRARRRYF